MLVHVRRWILAMGVAGSVCGCQVIPDFDTMTREHGARAQLFDDLGTYSRTVTTSSPEAQRYFDQGLNWTYAFNHDEAIRSFSKAALLDPGCAMAWWGIAYCQGPNYNDVEMTALRNAGAWGALQKAVACLDNTTPAEQSLIEALSARYSNPAPEDRSELDRAYAEAMAAVAERYSDDSDIATLYADALMVRMPWKLYDLEFEPAEDTPRILEVLEHAMELAPGNPGARHLYIHATEPSEDPRRGLKAAGELRDMVPAAGHLQHMPSHTYVKTGYWAEAITQNEKAMAADTLYRTLSPEQGVQHMYMTHNSHMLAFAAMMSGREREAMAAARAMWAGLPPPILKVVGEYVDLLMCAPYDVQKRFGRWDALLAEPAPPEYLPITTSIWRAHRAIAYAAQHDFDNAERELEASRKVRASIPEDHLVGYDLTHTVLEISDHFVRAEILLQQDRFEEAAGLLEKAAEIEDTLSYGEPPHWLQPVRHTLGVVYLKSGRNEDAERVYREDLRKWPSNGWSLYGLAQGLRRQGKTDDAREAMAQYQKHWSRADAPITTSCVCVPEP